MPSFSERSMLEFDMLGFAARVATEVTNDGIYDDLSQQSKRSTISKLGFRGGIGHRWAIWRMQTGQNMRVKGSGVREVSEGRRNF